MPKKTITAVADVQNKIAVAEKAVAHMKDESLKAAAFQVILGKLLTTSDLADEGHGGARPIHEAPSKGIRAKKPTGLKARIEALMEDGFFAEQQTLGEVKGALAAQGLVPQACGHQSHPAATRAR